MKKGSIRLPYATTKLPVLIACSSAVGDGWFHWDFAVLLRKTAKSGAAFEIDFGY